MLHRLSLVLFVYLHLSRAGNQPNGNPTVITPYGEVEGSYSESYSGRTYSRFLSVPYAQPPIGDLRFKEPQPLQKWHGTWKANFTSICAQWAHAANGGHFLGQEDCLHLNIFAPKVNFQSGDQKLDVIIDTHGGGLNFGWNSYYSGEKHFMDEAVILVTINYRVGPLGFLSTEDEVVPGNNGMKDQVAAIKWVKENIKYFGGNPESITLTGLSAGGASVHYHYMSPLTKGLFKGGISASGSALCPWTFQENALQQTRKLGETVGCAQESTKDLINCMKHRSVTQILEGTQIFRPWLYNPFSVFGVVVEKHGNEPYLSKHPYELLVKGEIHDLPWITSVSSHEGLYPTGEFIVKNEYLEKLENHWEDLASHIFHYEHTVDPELKPSVAKKIREFYFKDKPISIETMQELIKVSSDRHFINDAEKSARLQAQANKSPTYFYYFTYRSEVVHSFIEILNMDFKERPGTCHGDDLAFIFNYPKIPLPKLTENDFKMKEILMKVWTSFAHTGKPDLSEKEWTPVSNKPDLLMNYLHIESPDQLVRKQTKDLGNRAFWDSLKFKENEYLFSKPSKNEL